MAESTYRATWMDELRYIERMLRDNGTREVPSEAMADYIDLQRSGAANDSMPRIARLLDQCLARIGADSSPSSRRAAADLIRAELTV